MSRSWTEDAVVAALRTAVVSTDAAFLERARAEGLEGGTTAVFALLCGQRVLVGSIGDSYAILCGCRDTFVAADAAPTSHGGTALHLEAAAAPAADGREMGGTSEAEHAVRAEVLSALHSPGRQDEKRRVELAGGWVKTTAGLARSVLAAWTAAVAGTVTMYHVMHTLCHGSAASSGCRRAAPSAGRVDAVPCHW
jgi:Protein phosphatase 2C